MRYNTLKKIIDMEKNPCFLMVNFKILKNNGYIFNIILNIYKFFRKNNIQTENLVNENDNKTACF